MHFLDSFKLSSSLCCVHVVVQCPCLFFYGIDIGNNAAFDRKRMDATLKTMEEQQMAKRDEVSCPLSCSLLGRLDCLLELLYSLA